MKKISLVILVSLICGCLAEQADSPQCKQPIDKSAVTKEAADEAAEVAKNPPVYTSEIYSSKVKSNLIFFNNL